jgi:lipopolysaccharide export system protein LptA
MMDAGMRLSTDKLRRWILLAGVALAAVIVVLLLYGEHEKRRLLRELPARLGADIQQQSSEFTYSQSYQGQTLFTLHAAKAVQMKEGGHVLLHDVSIVLYGRKQDRADRIAGQEFDYDPGAGVARALGEVFLDLQTPAKAVAAAPKTTAAADATRDLGANGGVVHVVTRGLVFQQKQAVATTDQAIEFRLGNGLQGHATGAEYDSSHGLLTLNAAVTADGVQRGHPVHLTATHGTLERDTNLCRLEQATYMGGGETAQAEHAVVKLRTDGSAEQVELRDAVRLEMAGGGVLTAPHAVADLNAASEPQRVDVAGGVHYADTSVDAKRGSKVESQGDAAEARIRFDAQGVARAMELTGGVHVVSRERLKGAAAWTERELAAARVDAVLAGAVGAPPELRSATASGDARMRLTEPAKRGTQTSTLTGDRIAAEFAPGSGALLREPRTVHGEGSVVMVQTAADGSVNESRGDVLDATISQSGKGSAQLEQAVLSGNVHLKQTPAKGAKQQPVTAAAERAVYTGKDDAMVLTSAHGNPMVDGNGMHLMAASIRMQRATGDVELVGAVRGNYAGGNGGQEASHVVAERAEMSRGRQAAVFHGGAAPARMWQGASQVQAPQLLMEKDGSKLTASGGVVTAVFAAENAANPAGVLRVSGGKMTYFGGDNAARNAVFDGDVTVSGVDGTVRSRRAEVYLTPTAQGGGAQTVTTGSVQKIVASGAVRLESGERRGRGEQLVYTPNAALSQTTGVNGKQSGQFELTGTEAAPPVLVDAVKGTVTGASLRFNSADDSVVVAGSADAKRAQSRLKVGQ